MAAFGAAGTYPQKPAKAVLGRFERRDVITVKFRDGLGFRAADGKLTGPDVPAVRRAIGTLGTKDAPRWQPVHDADPARLDRLRAIAEANLGQKLPDLNLQFFVYLPDGADAAAAIDALNALDEVEMAQGVPMPMPAPLPPSYEPFVHYAAAAPAGIGSRVVASWPGGLGQGVRVADLEYSWNRDHADLPRGIVAIGPMGPDPYFDADHGTAVLGEISGVDNGWGVTGAAPGATPYVACTILFDGVWNVAGAITRTALAFSPGDVILLEQQLGGPYVNETTPETQWGLVPVEWYRPNYDAIRTAVGAGIVVVEAAGNGSQHLDVGYSTGNGGHYPFLLQNDSGALIVGAGATPASFDPDRSRLYFSNFGQTLDLQGAGEWVVTTGYGDLFGAEGTELHYTSDFGGTSSASPIVASACAILQSIHKEATGQPLTPAEVRTLLVSTGSPQRSGFYPASQRIGPRPDVAAAVRSRFGAADCNGNGTPDALETREPTALTVSPQGITGAIGGSATFIATGAGLPPLVFSWERDGVPLTDGPGPLGLVAGSRTPTLTITGLKAAARGPYVSAMTNGCGVKVTTTATLTLPCPADTNGSGQTDLLDLFGFLTLWFAGDPLGDFDASGGAPNVADIFVYLSAWFAGC